MEIFDKLLTWFFDKFIKKDPENCEHSWHVYGTALSDVCIEVQCIYCQSWGQINDHTLDEWTKAGNNDINPYEWKDVSRIKSSVLDPEAQSINKQRQNDA